MGENRGFFGLPPEIFTALGTVAGFALLGGLSYDQQNALGNLLELTGQLILTNAAQGQSLQASASAQDPSAAQLSARLDELEAQLRALRARLDPPPGSASPR